MNWPTIIISIIIALIFLVIVIKGVINFKKGKGSCGCNCGGCAFNGRCHQTNTKKTDS